MDRDDEKFIDFTVNKDGTVDIEGKNFKGDECAKIIDKIQRCLGKQLQSQKKPEYYLRKESVSEKRRERE